MRYETRASLRRFRQATTAVALTAGVVLMVPSIYHGLENGISHSADQEPPQDGAAGSDAQPAPKRDGGLRCKIDIAHQPGSVILHAVVEGDLPVGTTLEYAADYKKGDNESGFTSPDVLSAEIREGEVRAADGHLSLPGGGQKHCDPYHAPQK